MAIKPTAITNEEIPMYEQEENLARLYERREEEYTQLLNNIKSVKERPTLYGCETKSQLAIDVCEFLLREAQYRKLV